MGSQRVGHDLSTKQQQQLFQNGNLFCLAASKLAVTLLLCRRPAKLWSYTCTQMWFNDAISSHWQPDVSVVVWCQVGGRWRNKLNLRLKTLLSSTSTSCCSYYRYTQSSRFHVTFIFTVLVRKVQTLTTSDVFLFLVTPQIFTWAKNKQNNQSFSTKCVSKALILVPFPIANLRGIRKYVAKKFFWA